MPEKQNIVVVGSGGGGVALIQELHKRINPTTHQIIVIEKRDFYAHWPALIRASVTSDGSVDEASLIPFDRAFDPSIRFVHSSAKQITSTDVITEAGERISYAQLALATGSVWSGALALPESRTAALQHLQDFRRRLESAQNILIIGGGAVGLEYVGELYYYFPQKKVTLIHGLPELVNDTYNTKFRTSLLDAVKKLGAEVILGDRISTTVEPTGGYVTTEKGLRVKADFVINATGGRPDASVVSSLDPSVVTKRGTVLVTPELNVRLASGARNVWALGDIIEWPEQKMVYKASTAHAPLVASNIIAALKSAKLKPYKSEGEAIFITLGPKGGRGTLPFFGGINLGDWPVSMAKSADLFIKPIREKLGYGPEKSGSGKTLWALGVLAVPVAYVLYTQYSG